MKGMVFVLALCAAMTASAEIDRSLAGAALEKGVKIAVWPAGKVPAQKGASAFGVKDTNGGIHGVIILSSAVQRTSSDNLNQIS